MNMRPLVIGTRGSHLALFQANQVKGLLPGPSEIRIIKTSGDRFQEASLGEQGGAGFFTREIEEALAEGSIDLAVHSLKDLPVRLPTGMAFGAILERVAVNDVLLVRPEALAPELPFPVKPGMRVGTSANRRQSLLARVRPDLTTVPMRGNVPTRVEKALRGDCDALLLAKAGLVRLRHDPSPLVPFDLNPTRWPGAPGQAAVAVEIRDDDDEIRDRLASMHHAATARCVSTERELLLASGGGCHSAFCAWAVEGSDHSRIVVGMPGKGGGFLLRHFLDPSMEVARTEAEAWILAGAPGANCAAQESEWLCRPAPAWY